jgi:hypothetical protein
LRTAAILAPPTAAPAGAAGALGVGATGAGTLPPAEDVELARPIFVGVASVGNEFFLETFARPIVNGIIDAEAEDFFEFFYFLLYSTACNIL